MALSAACQASVRGPKALCATVARVKPGEMSDIRRQSLAVAAAAFVALATAACGGDDDGGPGRILRDGLYEFEVTREYLASRGLPETEVRQESGMHTVTLDDGVLVNEWRDDFGDVRACRATYVVEGTRLTGTWTSSCVGDWEATFAIDGDTVSWSAVKSLPPYDGELDQKMNEALIGVPWTRIGDVPAEGGT